MAVTGRQIASTALAAVALALFIPVFADVAVGFTYPEGWAYGPYLETVLEQFEILVAVGVIIVVGVLLK